MSKTRIKDSLRLAIYDAYRGKCFYTEEPVPYQDFELDHIIPESRESDIEDVKKRLGLSDDFHINSVENLVPSRPGINLRKNGQIFSDYTLLLYFEQTKAKKATIEALHEKYKKQSKLGDGYKAIEKLLVSGKISMEKINDYILYATGALEIHTIDYSGSNKYILSLLGEKLLLFGCGINLEMKREKGTNVELPTMTEDDVHEIVNGAIEKATPSIEGGALKWEEL